VRRPRISLKKLHLWGRLSACGRLAIGLVFRLCSARDAVLRCFAKFQPVASVALRRRIADRLQAAGRCII
jgi:hypothetical protein